MRRTLVLTIAIGLTLVVSMSTLGVLVLAGAGKSGGLLQPEAAAKEYVHDSPIADADWTVIVYLDGDNNLETSAIQDLVEMEKIGSKAGVNVVVLMDTLTLTEGTHWYYIGQDTEHVNLTEGTNHCDCETITGGACPGELNMADGATLTYCIETAASFAPAENYMLVLWDHGGGWYGVCWDDSAAVIENSGKTDRLSVDETGNAIAAAEVELDVIAFDACFSGAVEFAYELKDLADYMAASITTVPGAGYAYDNLLAGMTEDSTMDAYEVSKLVADTYVQWYAKCPGSGIGGYPYVEMSVIDLSNVEALVTGDGGIGDLAEALIPLLEDEGYRGLIESAESMTPQIQFSGEQFPFIDIGLYAAALGDNIPELSELTEKLLAHVQDAVAYLNFVATATDAPMKTYGISLYFTCCWNSAVAEYSYETYEEAEAAGALPYYGLDLVIDTDWEDFLEAFVMSQAEVDGG
jgi:hypothetical protein